MSSEMSERFFEEAIVGTLTRGMVSKILLDVNIKNLRRQRCRLELWNG